MIADSCRVAESTVQLRSLVQSVPQHPVMPNSQGLVPAIYLTAIKAYIHEGAYKEAMDLCEKVSSTFSCKGWLLISLHVNSHCAAGL